jgi:hypothetical protein
MELVKILAHCVIKPIRTGSQPQSHFIEVVRLLERIIEPKLGPLMHSCCLKKLNDCQMTLTQHWKYCKIVYKRPNNGRRPHSSSTSNKL